jgi:UDP-glucose 6-dehydrogenase
MRLSVFDLRCVGAVSSAGIAHDGVDINPSNQQLTAGQAPLVELGLPEPVDAAVAAGRLSVTTDRGEAVYKSGFSVICVGKGEKSEPDLNHVKEVSRQIDCAVMALAKAAHFLSVFLSVMGVSLASKKSSISTWKQMHSYPCGNFSNA